MNADDAIDLCSSDSDDHLQEAAGSRQIGAKEQQHNESLIDLAGSSDDSSAGSPLTKIEAASAAEASVRSYGGRVKAHKRMKANPWAPTLSRKKSRQARRAPVKDSKRIYHGKTMKTVFIQAYLQLPGVREGIERFRALQEEESKLPAPTADVTELAQHSDEPRRAAEPEIAGVEISADEDEDKQEDEAPNFPSLSIPFPASVTRSLRLNNPEGFELADDWPSEICGCIGDCYPDTCLNATTTLFGGSDNCTFRGRCSNGVNESHDVELFASGIGIGVRAVDTLHVGSTVAPYTGILTNHDYNTDANQHEYVVALQARARGRVKNKLYIDAEEWGTVARFINHSCEPNTEFVEMRHNREVHVMVKVTSCDANRRIEREGHAHGTNIETTVL
ncbi:SET domain-containing protein [Phytophthora infestans]|uniref:SET domain-containing protein n=1 Tax=Phytophthora infestans TaxID=4787 RepID=A0A8S9V5A9_PHYIN|nr:SET domain-containing protein [Phytophthora infestans]